MAILVGHRNRGLRLSGILSGDGGRMLQVSVPEGGEEHHGFDEVLEPHEPPTSFFVGERALVSSVLDWASTRCPTDALGMLRLPSAHITYRQTLAMREELKELRTLCARSKERGLGLFTDMSKTPARALICDPPHVQLELNGLRVVSSLRGLAVESSNDVDPSLENITGWHRQTAGVNVVSKGKARVVRGNVADLLMILGRHAPTVRVAWTPLERLIAPLLVFLDDATELATSHTSDMYTHTGYSDPGFRPGVVVN